VLTTAAWPQRLLPAREVQVVRAFEFILRRPNGTDRVRYLNRAHADIGDVVMIDDWPWVVVEKEAPFELRRIERIICVPRKIGFMH
jgi:hypothetical protein